jgi:hypothetical protein
MSDQDQWISPRAASLILSTTTPVVKKLAEAGRLTRRKVPFYAARYRKSEVEALAREFTQEARR